MVNDKKYYMPSVKITEKVKEKLVELKKYYGAKTFNEVINLLLQEKLKQIEKEKN